MTKLVSLKNLRILSLTKNSHFPLASHAISQGARKPSRLRCRHLLDIQPDTPIDHTKGKSTKNKTPEPDFHSGPSLRLCVSRSVASSISFAKPDVFALSRLFRKWSKPCRSLPRQRRSATFTPQQAENSSALRNTAGFPLRSTSISFAKPDFSSSGSLSANASRLRSTTPRPILELRPRPAPNPGGQVHPTASRRLPRRPNRNIIFPAFNSEVLAPGPFWNFVSATSTQSGRPGSPHSKQKTPAPSKPQHNSPCVQLRSTRPRPILELRFRDQHSTRAARFTP